MGIDKIIDKPKIHSAFILIAVFIFFPVGIALLIIRFIKHRNYNHFRAKDYTLVGHSFVTFGAAISGLVLLVELSSQEEDMSGAMAVLILSAIIFGIPAILFYVLGATRKKKMDNLYQMYNHFITAQGVESIDRITELTGESIRNVTQDLSYMIASEKLQDAKLDTVRRSVTLNNRTATGPNSSENASDERRDNHNEDRQAAAAGSNSRGGNSGNAAQSVLCSGCGSSSRVIPGRSQECEFCGNVISIPV
ncbi:hypothetical protein [Cohnella sp. WQ 127256]|uniref:hypothetical protein n=1 Tax=Cohnella sp. WQ 127256 TaxID=2938790 RepID=UPI002119A30D|nr:hypothetical protein [Cohnella sp. WQ 127256]